MAVGFTALVNTLILATSVFTEWISAEHRFAGYGLVVLAWLVGWWQSRASVLGEMSGQPNGQETSTETAAVGLATGPGEQLFGEAQRAYLRGDWVAAEQLLLKLLKLSDRDAEARLMLATLWRRQGRHRESLRQLEKLARLEVADRWKFEIAREQQENAAALDITVNDTVTDTQLQVTETPSVADVPSSAADEEEFNEETNRRLAA